jgi:hypothetical protein
MKTTRFLLCTAALLIGMAAMGATFYVKPNGNDANSGASWETAKATISGALDNAARNDLIFVAQGTYFLTEEIYLRNGINIYGGFAGTETSLEERPPLTFGETATGQSTILDAQGSENEQRRAVMGGAFSVKTVIDGFVIENGCTTDVNMNAAGGGVYLDVNCQLNNSTVRYCRGQLGGGVYCRQNAVVSNCLVSNNRALGKAGGIACSDGSMAINCYIINNMSEVEAGGAYAGRDAVVAPGKGSAFIGCLIANNTAVSGGGVYCSIAGIINCTIVNNHATGDGGGLLAYMNYPALTNCIFWGNTKGDSKTPVSAQINGVEGNTKSATYCAVQGGYTGNGASNITNLAASNTGSSGNFPEFANPSAIVGRSIIPAEAAGIMNADWRITETSIAKNKGTTSVSIAGSGTVEYPDIILPELDLGGRTRINDGAIDLGAYEYTPQSAIKQLNAGSIKTYPNPVIDRLRIETVNAVPPTVKLYNMQGLLLLQTQSAEIDFSAFAPGIYFLQIDGENIKVVKK